jgi:hypothetical protein
MGWENVGLGVQGLQEGDRGVSVGRGGGSLIIVYNETLHSVGSSGAGGKGGSYPRNRRVHKNQRCQETASYCTHHQGFIRASGSNSANPLDIQELYRPRELLGMMTDPTYVAHSNDDRTKKLLHI